MLIVIVRIFDNALTFATWSLDAEHCSPIRGLLVARPVVEASHN